MRTQAWRLIKRTLHRPRYEVCVVAVIMSEYLNHLCNKCKGMVTANNRTILCPLAEARANKAPCKLPHTTRRYIRQCRGVPQLHRN